MRVTVWPIARPVPFLKNLHPLFLVQEVSLYSCTHVLPEHVVCSSSLPLDRPFVLSLAPPPPALDHMRWPAGGGNAAHHLRQRIERHL